MLSKMLMLWYSLISALLVAQGTDAMSDSKSLRQPSGRANATLFFASGNCSTNQFRCKNEKCINGDLACDGNDSCGDESDETFCQNRFNSCWPWQESCVDGQCSNESFRCNNGKCINLTSLCDRIDDCGDGSDELRAVAGFKCPLGEGGDICVLPKRYTADKIKHCNNDADESRRTDGSHRAFRCFDGSMVIADSQQCDGVVDCRDLSDECLCEDRNEHICSRICTNENQIGATNCTLGNFVCHNATEVDINKVCDGVIDCKGAVDEIFCSKNSSFKVTECAGDVNGKTRRLARVCDGRPECFDFSDECISDCARTSLLPAFCDLNITVAPFSYECTTVNGTKNLTVQDVCNGKWSECSPRIEVEEIDCPGRFYCTSGKLLSIDIGLQCSGYAECDDASDEANCSGSRFYCEDNRDELLSVPLSFLSDGVGDCRNGKDECPSLSGKPIASEQYLIAMPFFQVWIWIAAFSCLFGNIMIIGKKIRRFPKIRKSGGLVKSNQFFIFNLAIADSLMGIYLLGISVKHTLVAGSYCRHDIRWRTGAACSILGGIAVASSEASVSMLVLLTTLRLISVHYPLKTRNMKFKWSVLAVGVAWAIALTLAFLPHSLSARHAFTYGAFIPSKYISETKVGLNRVNKFASLLSIFTPNSTLFELNQSWQEVDDYLKEFHPDHSIRGHYGYYSEFSVCMPNFYVTTNEPMWGYSFAIILLNFLIFMYILVAYIAIYRKTTRRKVQSTSADISSSMQRKVIRIISSDFLCWMPVCIIAFLTLSRAIPERALLYSLTAIVILPINSILNPFLYSEMCDKGMESLTFIAKKLFRFHDRETSETPNNSNTPSTKV